MLKSIREKTAGYKAALEAVQSTRPKILHIGTRRAYEGCENGGSPGTNIARTKLEYNSLTDELTIRCADGSRLSGNLTIDPLMAEELRDLLSAFISDNKPDALRWVTWEV